MEIWMKGSCAGMAIWIKCSYAMHRNLDEMWLCLSWQFGLNVAVLGMAVWMKCGCARHGNLEEYSYARHSNLDER
jgi:hypothetical protein